MTTDDHAIWKTPLYLEEGDSQVNIKVGARPLSLQIQNGVPTIWWVVDLKADNEKRKLSVVGTGWIGKASEFENYIGTWQDLSGLVWHVFDSK